MYEEGMSILSVDYGGVRVSSKSKYRRLSSGIDQFGLQR